MLRSCLFFVFCPTTFARFLTCWLPFILSHSFTFFSVSQTLVFLRVRFFNFANFRNCRQKISSSRRHHHHYQLPFAFANFLHILFSLLTFLCASKFTRTHPKKAQPHTHSQFPFSLLFFFPFFNLNFFFFLSLCSL